MEWALATSRISPLWCEVAVSVTCAELSSEREGTIRARTPEKTGYDARGKPSKKQQVGQPE
jgi:hypothetical protein